MDAFMKTPVFRLGQGGILSMALLTSSMAAPPNPPALDTSTYLVIETGTLPVVLSAPHGGTLALPGMSQRSTGVTTLDIHTCELSEAIQTKLRALTGKQAHRVAGLASRRFVDFNRGSDQAFESHMVAPLHQAYHAALGRAVQAAKVQGGKAALLVDLHGHGAESQEVFRGTRNGSTSDLVSLQAASGFLGALTSAGVHLNPRDPEAPETPRYGGGYIVMTYGLGQPDGIPAVQLEFGVASRKTPWNIDATAAKVAQAIVSHLKANGAL
jgi:N-formylglutamate amidohydrolase